MVSIGEQKKFIDDVMCFRVGWFVAKSLSRSEPWWLNSGRTIVCPRFSRKAWRGLSYNIPNGVCWWGSHQQRVREWRQELWHIFGAQQTRALVWESGEGGQEVQGQRLLSFSGPWRPDSGMHNQTVTTKWEDGYKTEVKFLVAPLRPHIETWVPTTIYQANSEEPRLYNGSTTLSHRVHHKMEHFSHVAACQNHAKSKKKTFWDNNPWIGHH